MNDVEAEYKLTPQEHGNLQQDILDIFLAEIPQSKNPVAIIIGGQPGCGKTGIIEMYQNRMFLETQVCIINGDELRRFHPKSDEIFERYEKQYSELTDLDVRTWTSTLFDEAIRKKVNLIFEGTMRTSQIGQTVTRLKAEGYTVIVCPLAVSYALSVYSICKRFVYQKSKLGKGRYVDFDAHDAAYHGIPITLEAMIEKNDFQSIRLYGRTFGNPKYALLQTESKLIIRSLSRFRTQGMPPAIKRRFIAEVKQLAEELNRLGELEIVDEMGKRISKGLKFLK